MAAALYRQVDRFAACADTITCHRRDWRIIYCSCDDTGSIPLGKPAYSALRDGMCWSDLRLPARHLPWWFALYGSDLLPWTWRGDLTCRGIFYDSFTFISNSTLIALLRSWPA
jgi:hypothetical protein